MKNSGFSTKKVATDIIYDVLSATLLAVALTSFASPNNIAPGGVSGLAVIVNSLTNIPLGVLTMLANIPLLFFAYLFLGRKFAMNTIRTVSIQTVVLLVLERILPSYKGDHILAALFGGLFMGTAIAAAFMRGTSTGGSDIISRLVQKKIRHLPIGKVMLCFDVIVITISMLVYRNIESGLYALISIFTSSRVVDGLLYGLNRGKVLLIFSDKVVDIAKEIMSRLHRGCTLLNAQGAYSSKNRQVLMCAVRTNEYCKVEEIIKSYDPEAFVLTLEAGEIQGQGFRYLTEDKVT